MPEGDTVFLAATRMHAALAGQRLLATDFRVPRFATADLSGQVVREVAARGKHLLLRTDAGTTLHTHFKMEGAWHLYRPRERWRGPAFQVRAVLRTDPWVAVGFRLAICELLPTASEHEVVGHLGPDVLGPDWDPAEALRRLRADPDRAIGTALLDQRTIAGPGNVYKSEVCFLSGVDPWTPVGAGRWVGSHGRPPQAPDGGQPHHRQPDHHRRHPPRPHQLGRRPHRQALPPLRHPHPQGRPAQLRRRPGHLLVPHLPAGAGTGSGYKGVD